MYSHTFWISIYNGFAFASSCFCLLSLCNSLLSLGTVDLDMLFEGRPRTPTSVSLLYEASSNHILATDTTNIRPSTPTSDFPPPLPNPLPKLVPKVMQARPIKPVIKQVNERLEAKGIKQTPVQRRVEPASRRSSREQYMPTTPLGFLDMKSVIDPNRPLTPLPPCADIIKREMIKELKPFNPDLPLRGFGSMLVNSPLPFAEAKSPPPPPPPPTPPPRITEMSDELSLNIFETHRVDVGPKSGVVKTRTGDTKTMTFEDEKFIAEGSKAIEESDMASRAITETEDDGIVLGEDRSLEKQKLVEGGLLKTNIQYIVKEGEEVEVTIKAQQLEPDERIIVEVPKKETVEDTKLQGGVKENASRKGSVDGSRSNTETVELKLPPNKKTPESSRSKSPIEVEATFSLKNGKPVLTSTGTTKKESETSLKEESISNTRKESQGSIHKEITSTTTIKESQTCVKQDRVSSSRKQSQESVKKESISSSRKQSTSSQKHVEDDKPYEQVPVKDLIDSYEHSTRPVMRPKTDKERIPTPAHEDDSDAGPQEDSRQTQFVSYSSQTQQPFKPNKQPINPVSSSEPIVISQQHFETSQTQQGQQKSQAFHYQSQQVVINTGSQQQQQQSMTDATFQPISHNAAPTDDQQFYVANTKVETRTFPTAAVSEKTQSLEESSFSISKKSTSMTKSDKSKFFFRFGLTLPVCKSCLCMTLTQSVLFLSVILRDVWTNYLQL